MCDNNIHYYDYTVYYGYYSYTYQSYCDVGYSYYYESCCYYYYYGGNTVTGLDIFLWCLYGILPFIFLIILICCCIRRRRQQ